MKMLEDLEEVVRLSDMATSGPWSHQEPTSDTCGFEVVQERLNGDVVAGEYGIHEYDDARLIASAVNFIRAQHAAIADMAKRLEAAERDAARYRWLRNRAITFERDEGRPGTPYCVYGLGMGDAEPTYGTELDAMVDDAKSIDEAAMQETRR